MLVAGCGILDDGYWMGWGVNGLKLRSRFEGVAGY